MLEIETKELPRKRKGSRATSSPRESANFRAPATQPVPREGKASGARLSEPEKASHVAPLTPNKSRKGAGGGHLRGAREGHSPSAAASISDRCGILQELGVRRRMFIKIKNGMETRIGHRVARMMGFDPKDGAQDASARKRKEKIVTALLAGKASPAGDEEIYAACRGDAETIVAALAPINQARANVEKEMEAIAKTLPAYSFVASVPGFSAKGLAVWISETGDLSEDSRYTTREKLWKRLGLAPYKGQAYSNWQKKGGLTKDEWETAGYRGSRRAEVYAFADPLLRTQTVVKGRYRAIYDKRRAHTQLTHPDWTKGHSHDDAMRIMSKALVRDLWRAWRTNAETPGE